MLIALTSFELSPGAIAFALICCYLLILLTVALAGRVGYKKNSAVDYFLASRACGSFLLVMTIFGTTMSSFALVGSTNEAFHRGISVYGQMASWSGLIHSACFFLIGTKLWYHGKRFGYSTQIQFFRDRFQSSLLGYILFPILVGWVVPYVMLNIIGSGTAIETVTKGAFPGAFPATSGGVPQWLGSAVVCIVVLIYVFSGGMRSLSFANGIHATVLVALGGIILFLVVGKLGGLAEATRRVAESRHAGLLTDAGSDPSPMTRMEFFTYLFVPLSVGMFPHLFQHWMTAKDVKTFRPVVILHPLFIMLVWAPCILLGVWATSATFHGAPLIAPDVKNVLAAMVAKLTNPVVAGFLAVGIVSATMSLDSQFLALSSMFTHDIIAKLFGETRFSDRQRIFAGRTMVVAIVATAYILARNAPTTIYELGVWCFSGFAGLFPLIFAALYWRRVTTAGAIASIVATLAVWGYLFRESHWGANKYLFHGMLPAAAIFAASAVTIVVVSLVTRPPAAEVVSRFFSDEEEAAAGSADLSRVST
jgi:SSS family solute:Na+ symporter